MRGFISMVVKWFQPVMSIVVRPPPNNVLGLVGRDHYRCSSPSSCTCLRRFILEQRGQLVELS